MADVRVAVVYSSEVCACNIMLRTIILLELPTTTVVYVRLYKVFNRAAVSERSEVFIMMK